MTTASRRWRALCALALAGCVLSAAIGCGDRSRVGAGHKVIVLGIDGFDHQLATDLLAAGRLPNLARLAAQGGFQPLATSTPPLSPVAWSTFITGLDPGGHGIFDFIHREPTTLESFLSTSRTVPPGRMLTLGSWQFPLSAGHVDLLRGGDAFWDVLEQRGIETTIVRMPANFPPSGTATRELSGMGTPDMLGTYGIFTLFSSKPDVFERQDVSGGVIQPIDVIDDVARGAIEGPSNPYLVTPTPMTVAFAAHVDASGQAVQIVVGDERRVLEVGEWSSWVPIALPMLPFSTLPGQVRFLLKSLTPYFELYVSPINLDPYAPALPISTPGTYAAELADATGRFYTQGMPEDTRARNVEALSADQLLAQARITADENRRQFHYVLDRFADGLLFYYFGHIDQVSHVMWRSMDPDHPAYITADAAYQSVVSDLYVEMDGIVGEAMASLGPDDLLVVMSDHGFAPWRRAVNINSWLRDHGYLVVTGARAAAAPGLAGVDWTRTRAYAVGLNGVYVNRQGRESRGIVPPAEAARLTAEIAAAMEATIDPATGAQAITKAFMTATTFAGRDYPTIEPDIIVGYARGARVSSDSALGIVAPDVFADNREPWSGDHSMDPAHVPGVLFTSRPLKVPADRLQTLAGSILAEFGITDFPRRRSAQ
ncbi:MAG: alkaline phosphatase family protein [Acidobacteria bacterium]|nr:alkaline phosphatase family protein [Acidobacteriota bacterium]